MGKRLRHQDSSISLQNAHPGCMWSILHVLHHQRWYHIKKRLPYKRHGDRRHAVVVGDSGSSTSPNNVSEVQKSIDAEMDNSHIEENTTDTEPSRVTKSSMKSRIKALIAEEMSKKRRSRHRRSSSCPTRTQRPRTNSIHHLEPIDELSANDEIPMIVNQDNEHTSFASTSDPLACEEPVTKNRKCDFCAAMLTASYLTQTNVDDNGKEIFNDYALLQDISEETHSDLLEHKSIGAKESKQFLDALDIFNTRKELFLKILQDQSSPLAHYLHSRRATNSKIGLTKSVSFPVAGSAGRRVVRESNLRTKQRAGSYAEGQVGDYDQKLMEFGPTETTNEHSMTSIAECGKDDTSKPILAKPEYFDNPSPSSPCGLKNRSEEKLVKKRFKNLREKIKHAIRESRKERHRIIMDSVLHKIPYGRRFSKDAKEENADQQELSMEKWSKYSSRSSCGSDQYSSAIGKGGRVRRTYSFHESLDRYCHLFESSFNRETNKHHLSERVKLRTEEMPSPGGSSLKSLGRIYSLPDLRSDSFLHSEDSPSSSARVGVDVTVSMASSRFDEQKTPGLSMVPENQIQLCTSTESGGRENLVGGDTLDDLVNVTAGESSSHLYHKIEPTLSPISNFQEDTSGHAKFSISEDSELTPRPLLFDGEDSLTNQQQESCMDSSTMDESTVNTQNIESRVKQYYDFLNDQVDLKDSAEFNYVRDILHLSGLSGNDLLGTWHSSDQPVDPSVFEEVEGCLLAEPDCSVDEEGHKCNHLLLFDLINEVLLGIYEKSFTYCPMPLNCRSHIRPMPVGYHVLEEVWANIYWYLSWTPEADQPLDDAVCRDLAKGDGWMNLQFDAECVGLELEDMIFDDLLDELIWT